jgi:phosphatidylserine decarboxylase
LIAEAGGDKLLRCPIWRSRVSITRHGLREIFLSGVACGALAALALWLLPGWGRVAAAVPAVGFVWVLSFFRDPVRRIPAGDGLVVAPADGTITEIADVREETYIKGEAAKIGIFLSVFNVHLNRAPVAGKVEHVHYTRGKFLDARDAAASKENERNAIGILADGGGRVLVKQISGAIARRIVCECAVGSVLAKGQKIGMIKFGSRTEVFVSKSLGLKVRVKIGDKVKAGSSVLGEIS